MSNNADDLLLLFERPGEPVFLPKGDKNKVFGVPEDYLETRFQNNDVTNRFGGDEEKITVNHITLPSFKKLEKLRKRDFFSLFLPEHRKLADHLIQIFMGMRTIDDLKSCGVYGRSTVNPYLFNYAWNVALLHRKDTKHLQTPPLCEVFPDKYVDGAVFHKARREADLAANGQTTVPLEIPLDYTASDLDEEHRVAYFREDLGINLHHWHWHLVYPFSGPQNIVNKDRRGELFYYMHQQLVARYNFERLSNKLPRVLRLNDLRKAIPEAYFPKMDSLASSRDWAARSPHTTLKDVNRGVEQIKFDITTLENWRDRLYEAAQTGRILNSQNQSEALREDTGINILGNLVEASTASVNPNYYGDLHNFGHVAIAVAHDPDNRFLESFSVMGDSATAMRDPTFYRWHAEIDNIFQTYKNTLQPYTADQLTYNGISVTGLEVSNPDGRNIFSTFWQQNDINLARGLDFSPRQNVFVRFTHLAHKPFEYRITINNNGPRRQGTVRIFMAPALQEQGTPYVYNDQRKLMVELDKFVVTLQPNENVIRQPSTQSSVTIPYESTFRDLNTRPQAPQGQRNPAGSEFDYCGCGWPQHMLIPKGSAEGLQATLFVMVSDAETDKVLDRARDNVQCRGAISYCGVRDSKYPDSKPMGYPFDRLGRRGVDTLQQFMTPNMRMQNVTIRFSGITERPGAQSDGRQPSRGRN